MNNTYRTRIYALILPIIAFIMIPFQVYGQFSVSGQVTDASTGKELTGVHVYLPGLKKGTVTDTDGGYELSGLPKGTITIEFSYLGYQTASKDIQFGAGQDKTLNVQLKPTTYQANQLVVLGNRLQNQNDFPQPTDVLSQQAITMSSHSTLWKTLEQTPGIARISNGPGIERPVIRGLSSNRILILNQNMPYNYQKWDPESGLSLSGNGTEQVQVIKGPATLMYGQGALGGVVNLIGEHPAPVGQINGDYTLKAFSNTVGINNNLSLKGSNTGYFWGIRGGFDSNADYTAGNGEDIPNTRYNDAQLHGFAGITRSWGSTKITYQFHQHENGIVDLKDLGQQDSGEKKPREIEKPYHKLTDNSILSETHMALGDGWMNVNLSFQNNEQQEFDAAPADTAKDAGIDLVLNTFNYQAKYDKPLSGNMHLHVGLQGDLQHNESKGEEAFIPNADIFDLGGFGLLTYQQSSLKLQAGIRYDIRSLKTKPPEEGGTGQTRTVPDEIDRNFNNFSWSAGATYNILPFWNIKTNIGAAFRAPNLAELTADGLLKEANRYEIGDNNLSPERNVEWDLGTNINTEDVTFSVSAYYNWVSNYIYQELQPTYYVEPQPNGQSNVYNIVKFRQHNAELWGGETQLSIHPQQLSWFHFTTAFSMVVGQLTDNAKKPLPMIPAHRWKNTLRLTSQNMGSLKNSYVEVGLDTYLKQDRISTLELATPGYTLTHAGLGASVPWGKQLVDINLAVHNLFDITYYNHLSWLKYDGIYNMGRNISLTVHIPFGL